MNYKLYLGAAIALLVLRATSAFFGPHTLVHELFALAIGTGGGFAIGTFCTARIFVKKAAQ